MSLKEDLAFETEIAASKKIVQTHTKAGWKHKERGAKAWEETCKIQADTQEVKLKTATVRLEIAQEVHAGAQKDLVFTREMLSLKGEGQQLKLQIKSLKVRGTSAPSTSINRSAANNIKSRTRVPVEV